MTGSPVQGYYQGGEEAVMKVKGRSWLRAFCTEAEVMHVQCQAGKRAVHVDQLPIILGVVLLPFLYVRNLTLLRRGRTASS